MAAVQRALDSRSSHDLRTDGVPGAQLWVLQVEHLL